MTPGRIRRAWIVEGRVQGVFFRQSTRAEAARIGGLSGFVRNRADATVEVVADGAAEAVEALARFIARGPAEAEVRSLLELPAPEGVLPEPFAITP